MSIKSAAYHYALQLWLSETYWVLDKYVQCAFVLEHSPKGRWMCLESEESRQRPLCMGSHASALPFLPSPVQRPSGDHHSGVTCTLANTPLWRYRECKKWQKLERSSFPATTLFWGHLIHKLRLTAAAPFPTANNFPPRDDRQACMCVISGVDTGTSPTRQVGLPFALRPVNTHLSTRLPVKVLALRTHDRDSLFLFINNQGGFHLNVYIVLQVNTRWKADP